MSGHSKWANIKRRKGAQDAKRGKLFTKLIKEIHVAAKLGGSDLDANARLRLAVDKAKANSMSRQTIERAIAKGAGELGGEDYAELTYEGYAPGGVAVLVKCLTDNRNRTAAEVRHAFAKGNGSLGSVGSVAYQFNQKGVFTLPKAAIDEDTLMMEALEAGAEDVEGDDEQWTVTCAREDYDACKTALEGLEIEELTAEIEWIPDNTVSVTGEVVAKVMRLLDLLDDVEDVQETASNADFDEEALAALEP